MLKPKALSPKALIHPCDPKTLNFKTTDELPSLDKILGQPRALRALEMGSKVSGLGFNIFVSGLPDSGRTTLTRDYIKQKAVNEPVPDDWCYVNNFYNPYCPNAINLPAGQVMVFKEDIKNLINRCRQEIWKTFHKDEYVSESKSLAKALENAQEAGLEKLQRAAKRVNFTIISTASGFDLTPLIDDKPISPEELAKLPKERRDELQQIQDKLEKKALETILKVREIGEEYHKKFIDLNRRTALFAIDYLVEAIKKKYSDNQKIIQYILAIHSDVVDNADKFCEDNEESIDAQWLSRYKINIIVNNGELKGSPVIVENHPTYQNLVGQIDYRQVMGVSQTDFTMIRPGALHRANGGYLLLPARDVLLNPYAWQGLEQALRDGKIRTLDLRNQFGLINTTSLEPESIPLSTKVILFGTPALYELLRQYDADFAKLFKVRADFATIMDRNDENSRDYALFIKSVVDENQLPTFDNTAVARIIEYSSRMVEDQNKLSTKFGQISDLVREAAFWAQKENEKKVSRIAVNRAIREKEYRNNLPEELVHEWINQGTILIDTEGEAIGQVNALSISIFGDYTFGHPSRVTASVYPGSKGVIDIEKQAELGGPIHTKGVLIINGLLGRRYGHNKPLSLTASLTFEQSYSGVEGDSASAAEFCTLLSAIADIPLRQDRAITGSINQLGEIQAIGGVNEKIEGFFMVCKNKGLTGSQGVIIPHSNIRNLMLKDEVIKEVKNNNFHIWPIRTVDEGLALLSDLKTGVQQDDGTYPKGTFNHAVDSRLSQFKEIFDKEE